MSTAHELLGRLTEIGAAIEPKGDHLILRAGPKPIPGELVRQFRRAKGEVLATLASIECAPHDVGGQGDDPDVRNAEWWRRQLTIRSIHWGLTGKRTKAEVEGPAYGELLDEWRRSHGRRWPVWQCAGCDEPIGGMSALLLADENRVHFDKERECLVRFGERWRSEATAGLQALGIEPPEGFELS
jgi:hypothetical protein